MLKQIMNEVKSEAKSNPWDGSENEWLKVKAAKVKGSLAEKIVKKAYESFGFKVSKSKVTDSDLLINGKKVEVKLSCCAFNKGIPSTFTFFQMRPKQDYDTLVFLCVKPNDVEIWEMDKEDFMNEICKDEKGIVIAGGKEKHTRLINEYGKDWLRENDLFHWMKPVNANWPTGAKRIM